MTTKIKCDVTVIRDLARRHEVPVSTIRAIARDLDIPLEYNQGIRRWVIADYRLARRFAAHLEEVL